jgi:type II secretory pathway component PulL
MRKSLFIDIKEGELNTYLFEIKQNKFEIKENKKYPIPDKYDFSLDGMIEDIENTYLSLPISSLNFRVIDLPFTDKDKIREVLPFELDGMILSGSDEVIFDDVILSTSGDTYRVLAVYVEKPVMKNILEKLKSYHIDPVFVTSIELKNMLKDFSLAKLLAPAELGDGDRVALAVEEMKTPTINLRRNEFLYTRDIKKIKKSLRVTAVLLISLMLVLSTDILVKILSTRHEITSLKNDMRKTYQEIFPEEKNIMNELYQLKAHMKELKNKERVFIGVNPLNLILKLSQIDRQGVVFNEVVAEREKFTLRGEAPSLSDIQKIKVELERLFDEVNISDSKASAQGQMLFTITAKERT